MKKLMIGLLKRSVLLLLLTSFLLLVGCKAKEASFEEFYQGDLSNVTEVELVDGSTGYDVITSDKEQIQDFIEDIKNIKFIRDQNQEKRDGFKYSIRFFENGEMTFQFGLTEINGHYYYTEPDMEPIVKHFFDMLE